VVTVMFKVKGPLSRFLISNWWPICY